MRALPVLESGALVLLPRWMSLAAKLFSSNEVPLTTGRSSKGFTDWSDDTVMYCTASHRAVLPSWSFSSKSNLKQGSNVSSKCFLQTLSWQQPHSFLNICWMIIFLNLLSIIKIYNTKRHFKNYVSLTIPPSQLLFQFSVSPYVLFTLQQLIEHVFVPGHDGQV